jgi:hypothetical protein
MVEAALTELQKSPEREFPELKGIYEDVESHYQARLTAAIDAVEGKSGPTGMVNLYEQVTRRYRVVERSAAIKLRDQDRISDEVLRDLLRNLDLLDARGNPGARSG